jgi:predicted nucleic acid-binding protein
MPTSGDRPQLLIDTSVAVALVAAGHEHHQATRQAVGSRSCGLSRHAAFETFSVLTRMPPPNRRTLHAVARLFAHNFPGSRFLSAQGTERLHARLAELGIAGVAVYDALVAATAAEHGIVLATRDRRAAETYRALEVDFELINCRLAGPSLAACPPPRRTRRRLLRVSRRQGSRRRRGGDSSRNARYTPPR